MGYVTVLGRRYRELLRLLCTASWTVDIRGIGEKDRFHRNFIHSRPRLFQDRLVILYGHGTWTWGGKLEKKISTSQNILYKYNKESTKSLYKCRNFLLLGKIYTSFALSFQLIGTSVLDIWLYFAQSLQKPSNICHISAQVYCYQFTSL